MRRLKMIDWEDKLDAWEEKYQPIKNHFSEPQGEFADEFVEDKFETYGEELDYVLSIADTEPKRVWTLVEGDDSNLYITSGYHLVNRLNYFITKNPCELKYEEIPYLIYEEENDNA
jgi:hypothetical protein